MHTNLRFMFISPATANTWWHTPEVLRYLLTFPSKYFLNHLKKNKPHSSWLEAACPWDASLWRVCDTVVDPPLCRGCCMLGTWCALNWVTPCRKYLTHNHGRRRPLKISGRKIACEQNNFNSLVYVRTGLLLLCVVCYATVRSTWSVSAPHQPEPVVSWAKVMRQVEEQGAPLH